MSLTMEPIDWPEEFCPSRVEWGLRTPRIAWTSPYTGQTQSISYAADRVVARVTLPPRREPDAARREAFFAQAASAGRVLRAYNWRRPVPLGTQRGAPTVSDAVAAGARQFVAQGTAGATFLAGDMIRVGSQVFMVAFEGCMFAGSPAVATLPVVSPVRAPISPGAAIVWDRPRLSFKVLDLDTVAVHAPGGYQMELELTLGEEL